MEKIVIRKVENEWQIATIKAGLYNTIVSCGSFSAAARYADDNKMKWEKYN